MHPRPKRPLSLSLWQEHTSLHDAFFSFLLKHPIGQRTFEKLANDVPIALYGIIVGIGDATREKPHLSCLLFLKYHFLMDSARGQGRREWPRAYGLKNRAVSQAGEDTG